MQDFPVNDSKIQTPCMGYLVHWQHKKEFIKKMMATGMRNENLCYDHKGLNMLISSILNI